MFRNDFILTAVSALLAAPALGVSLFVDNQDPACSDVTGNPYCSISPAVADAQAGDRVKVAAGTYEESVFVLRDISIEGAGTGLTRVDGGDLTTFDLRSDVTLEAMTITGSGNRGVISSGLVRLVDCEVTNNFGEGGGGIYQTSGTLELIRTVVSENTSDAVNVAGGAGIWTRAGDLFVADSTIIDNHNIHPGSAGGGVKFDGGTANFLRTTIAFNTSQNNGGGITAIGTSLTLVDSVVYGNEAAGSLGGVGSLGSELTLINTTVSGNRARDSAGVLHSSGGSLRLRNATIVENHSTSFAGVAVFFGGDSAVSNTLIADNTNLVGRADCAGTLISEGYNLIQTIPTSCIIAGDVTGNLPGRDPKILPLADNGGPTMTHALMVGSPARDTGSPAVPGSTESACPTADQRGGSRPLDGDQNGEARCDIGAYEAAMPFFADGFESGDTKAWSGSDNVVP